jgi:hypothetical protein
MDEERASGERAVLASVAFPMVSQSALPLDFQWLWLWLWRWRWLSLSP